MRDSTCSTAGVWELKRRGSEELSAQTAPFGRVVLASRGFRNVGMTTEAFSNQLKSHRKAEAFGGKVIKTKQGSKWRRERAG